jgi:hypothetical protein
VREREREREREIERERNKTMAAYEKGEFMVDGVDTNLWDTALDDALSREEERHLAEVSE